MNSPEPSPTPLDLLIVGAGISGLSLAQAIDRQEPDARPVRFWVVERQDRVGGNITTAEDDGFLWEEGPTSFTPSPALLRLITELGLEPQLILADRRLPRYVYWRGKMQPVPMSPSQMVSTSLLSPWGKLRALVGALGFVRPEIGLPDAEETVDQFFTRHLGAEVGQRLVAPFVSGVYAGDVHQLSARAAFGRITQLADLGGGLLAGAVRSRLSQPKSPPDPNLPQTKPGELGSFKDGLQALPRAIAARLQDRLKLNWQVQSIAPTECRTYRVELVTPTGPQQVEARSVVFTSPAYVTAELLSPLSLEIGRTLGEIDYPPVACVVLAYPQTCFREHLRGFGNLIPRNQGIRTLGTIWSSSLFPGRAPQGWQLLTNFIGGATDREVGNMGLDALAQAVHRDLKQTLLASPVEPKILAVHLWRRAIPQYTLGHLQRLARLERELEQWPGLYLCSNYWGGVALGDRVQRGQETAAAVDHYLHQP